MSRMNDLQADRDRRLFSRHLGEDGMDGAPAPDPADASLPNVMVLPVTCPTPNCGLEGRATVTDEPWRIDLDMRCPCEADPSPEWVAECRGLAVRAWTTERRRLRAAAKPAEPTRPARGRDTYNRGAGRWRRRI